MWYAYLTSWPHLIASGPPWACYTYSHRSLYRALFLQAVFDEPPPALPRSALARGYEKLVMPEVGNGVGQQGVSRAVGAHTS